MKRNTGRLKILRWCQMINPNKARRLPHTTFNRFRGSNRTHVNIQDSASDCGIEFEDHNNESEFYVYSLEEQSGIIGKKDLFKEYAEVVNDTALSIIENDIKEIIKGYSPDLKYVIKYDIDVEEPIPVIIIKLGYKLPVDEEISFLKYVWRNMRKRGHKELLKKVSVVVDYE